MKNLDRFKFKVWDGEKLKEINSYYWEEWGSCANNLQEALPNGEILIQSTGVKDKNGKLIYEGDIVKTDWQHDGMTNYDYEVVGEIKWDEERYQWSIEQDNLSEGIINIFPLYSFEREILNEETVEIVGNIYENPELLK